MWQTPQSIKGYHITWRGKVVKTEYQSLCTASDVLHSREKTPQRSEETEAEHKGEKETARRIDRATQASWEDFTRNKYHLHAESKGWCAGGALNSCARAFPHLLHPFPIPLPQQDTGTSPKCANTKTPPAVSAQKWYLNYPKGQPWQAQQPIPALESRVRINLQKWNSHKCTSDKMMPARTIQILINSNMRLKRRRENIISGDKLTKRLAANKMDDEIGNHPYYLSFLNSIFYYLSAFHPVFKSHFKLTTEQNVT